MELIHVFIAAEIGKKRILRSKETRMSLPAIHTNQSAIGIKSTVRPRQDQKEKTFGSFSHKSEDSRLPSCKIKPGRKRTEKPKCINLLTTEIPKPNISTTANQRQFDFYDTTKQFSYTDLFLTTAYILCMILFLTAFNTDILFLPSLTFLLK